MRSNPLFFWASTALAVLFSGSLCPIRAQTADPRQAVLDDMRLNPWHPEFSGKSAPVPASSAPAVAPVSRAVAGGGWQVQLGSLSTREAAQTRLAEIRAKLPQATLSILEVSGSFKLRWGPFADKAGAQNARNQLKTQGLDGFLVAP